MSSSSCLEATGEEAGSVGNIPIRRVSRTRINRTTWGGGGGDTVQSHPYALFAIHEGISLIPSTNSDRLISSHRPG